MLQADEPQADGTVAMPRQDLQFVIKYTKYCNLRCSYCYEYPHLDDRRRIGLDGIERFLRTVAAYAPLHAAGTVQFIWHGGEPLLVPLREYQAIAEMQAALMPGLPTSNVTQTNLTALGGRHLAFLFEERFFERISFSFDVYGGERIDRHGRDSREQVLRNLQALLDRESETGTAVLSGAIVVLSRSNVDALANIVGFYDALGIGFRILPFHIEAVAGQGQRSGLPPDAIAAAMCAAFDRWLTCRSGIWITPLDEYLAAAISHIRGERVRRYAMAEDENVFLIETDGAVLGLAEDHAYGNVLDEPLEAVLASPARALSVAAGEARMRRHCGGCPYRDACPGHYVAHANAMEAQWLETFGCGVRPVIRHIVARLTALDLMPDAA